ncbi:N-methylhydantoinase A/oxoprolinase/acetone carboxylase, beta subunit [Methanosarcina thermophila]|jgi:N-methylhydantoinase A/oxoprolinase/acetone carboxylase beta subunit|uniref:Hydantoinase n=4 Tax=Methanosarcina thermophila TaxID=2210 RepID=A0A1I6Z302_METTE|nr:Hydantoinase [Methanosarcina thermophila TM-1]AKB14777.1 Hydantoinase [Methanosarcina thermophila CHTI-55]BAW29673.1 hydantoinase [Methanosarcina thermophila]GLI14776.1 hydantoinase [Methanosarcina thermophila MST-A1]SFT57103.1 N-methylhydantoinase A/oxoprolinase/acetone carboxylase, beta subunit [Methanosarcina thermophila]
MGIDAGGTYTDSVIIRDSDGKVMDSSKAPTTYPDLLEGIRNSIDGLDERYLKDVKMVSVSTTLATNTILEKNGYPVGLILVGDYEVPEKMDIEFYTIVKGGHDHHGAELTSLDLEAVEAFVRKVKDKVSAFAVSSYFSVRNPAHELAVKALIKELTGMPVVCGHELSLDLGAYERGITAYLNAQLIPVANQFIRSIREEISRRGMNSRLLMLKCDGSVVGINEALEKPIESIFSGPAASLVGASYLSGLDTCAVIDVGGTSTDVSMLENGLPELCADGAVVGGWQTKVKAIRMETSAMGGDSHIWVRNMKINIGPRRVIPLCVAAVKYPGFLETLRKGRIPGTMHLEENVQPTKFFVRTGLEPSDLGKLEKELFDRIGDFPTSLNDIFWETQKTLFPGLLDSLIRKRLIQAIGFTPTDALHVLGEYTEWDEEASKVGAKLLERYTQIDHIELCKQIKKDVARNMALNLLSFVLKDVPPKEIEKILLSDRFIQFRMKIPVVLIGGPVVAYIKELKQILDAEIIVPEHAKVGNAVGAVMGKGIKRLEILIKSTYSKDKKRMVLLFSPLGREIFGSYPEALEYADTLGRRLVMEYMTESGFDKGQVQIEVSKKDISLSETGAIPVETKLVFVGVGLPNV